MYNRTRVNSLKKKLFRAGGKLFNDGGMMSKVPVSGSSYQFALPGDKTWNYEVRNEDGQMKFFTKKEGGEWIDITNNQAAVSKLTAHLEGQGGGAPVQQPATTNPYPSHLERDKGEEGGYTSSKAGNTTIPGYFSPKAQALTKYISRNPSQAVSPYDYKSGMTGAAQRDAGEEGMFAGASDYGREVSKGNYITNRRSTRDAGEEGGFTGRDPDARARELAKIIKDPYSGPEAQKAARFAMSHPEVPIQEIRDLVYKHGVESGMIVDFQSLGLEDF